MEKAFMRNFLHALMLVALLCTPWVSWSQIYSFTCDFEDDASNASWSFANGTTTNNWVIGSGVNHGGSRALYISDAGTNHNYISNASSVYAYQTLDLPAGLFEYSFDWICKGESSFDYLRVALAPGSTSLVAGNYSGISTSGLPAGWIPLDGGSKLNLQNTWTTQMGTFEITNPGTYKLVFFWRNDGSTNNNPPAAIDNISLIIPSCPAPSGLSVSNITSDSVTVSWNLGSDAFGWEVECVPLGAQPGMGTPLTTIDNSVVISGLNSNTHYTVFVKSNCGNEMSNYASIDFTSACGDVTLPYRESFEDAERYGFPNCWTDLGGDLSVYQNSNYNPTMSHGLQYLKSTEGGFFATPHIAEPLNTLGMDLDLKMYDFEAGSLQVGVVTDLQDLASMQVLETVTPPDGLVNTFEFDFSSLDVNEGGYIVFKQVNYTSNYSALYIDNIFIRELPACRRPASMRAINVTHNSATLKWATVEGNSGYEVAYGTTNDPEAISTIVATNIIDDSLAIDDLQSETKYYIWVRSLCADEVSEWRAGGSFTTQLSCAKVLNASITSVSANAIALNWNYDREVGGFATQTEVGWKASGTDFYTTVISDNSYYIIQGLTPGTSYNIRLRTICDTDTSRAVTLNGSTEISGHIIGNSTTTNSFIPAACYFHYSYSQMLYPASELQGIDTIHSIAFKLANDNYTGRVWDVYMGHLGRSTITSNSPVPLDSLKLVSTLYFETQQGWCVVDLDSTFVHQSDSNLVIAIDDNTDSYDSDIDFYVHPGSAIIALSDDSDVDPSNLMEILDYDVVPDLMIVSSNVDPDACVAPLLVMGEVTSNSVDLAWVGNISNSYQVEYKLATDSVWTIYQSAYIDTAITITDLAAGVKYQFRVASECTDALVYSAQLNAFTLCGATEVPFFEDFTNTTLNPCFVIGNEYHHNIEEELPHRSSKALYLGYDPDGYLILPEFIDDISGLHTTFKIKAFDIGKRMAVAVGSNPNDIFSFEHIDTFTVSASNQYQEYECNFSNYFGDGHYIAFYGVDGQIYLDDILVDLQPNCAYPSNVHISNVMAENATLNWDMSVGGTISWMIVYTVQGSNVNDTIYVGASETSYDFNNLQPRTTYVANIYNICIGDTVAGLNPIQFTTECSTITLPYFENFESVPEDQFHPCWNTTNFHTFDDEYLDEVTVPVVWHVSDAGYDNVMVLSDNANFLTPRIPAEANTLMLSFDASIDDTYQSGSIAVGFSTSATNISSAVYVDTIDFSNTNWKHCDVNFSSLTSTDEGYIVFRNINNQYEYGNWYDIYSFCYIDNITIMVDNNCPVVSNVSVDNITIDGADITFEDASATGSYSIGYSTVNDVNSITSTIDCSTTTTTIAGLESGTRYYVWVRTNCPQGVSLWVEGPTFVTTCSAINELPYIENFDSYVTDVQPSITAPSTYPLHNLPSCWTFLNMSDSRSKRPQAFMAQLAAHMHYADSATCLMLISHADTAIYSILPDFETSITNLQISFTYRNEGTSDRNGILTLGVMTDRTDTATFIPLVEYPKIDEVTPVTHSFSSDNLPLSGNYSIAFRYQGGGNNFYLGLDNVVVDLAATCPIPEMLSVAGVTANSVTLTWSGSAANYNVQYRVSDSEDWIDGDNVSENTTIVAGLNAATSYQFRVQSVCGGEVSQWSSIVEASTACGSVSVPYSENFDSYTSGISTGSYAPSGYPNTHTLPNCWTFDGLGTSYPKAFLTSYSPYVQTGNCLYFIASSNTPMYSVLPAIDADLSSLIINFVYRNEGITTSNPNIVLGVVTNLSDMSSFIPLESYPVSRELTNAEHNFANDTQLNPSTQYYIAFQYGGNVPSSGYAASLEDIYVDYAPSCPKPSTPQVISLQGASVSLAWNSSATNFQLAYRIPDSTDWSFITIATSNYDLTGLSPITDYEVRVRAICSVGDTSDWSNTIEFTTACTPYQLPYSEDFSSGYNDNDIDCWARHSGLMSDILAGTDQLGQGSHWRYNSTREVNNGGVNANINIWNNSIHSWLISPNIIISQSADLQFDMARFDYYGNAVWQDDDKFVILATTNGGMSWTTVHTMLGTEFQTIPVFDSSFVHQTFDLSQFVGDTIQLAFYGESTVAGSDHTIMIDNVTIAATTTATCDAPTALVANNITTTGATLTWQGSASAYELEYRAQGTTDWIAQTLNTTTYTLSGLQPETLYEWRVKSVCGEISSSWVTNTFSTIAETPIPTCDAPTALVANNITTSGANLTWQGSASAYELEYRAQGTTDWNVQTLNTTTYTLSGLQSETLYEWRVKSVCGEISSDWVTSTFTTLAETPVVTCDVPSNITIEVNGNEATFDWTAPEGQSTWEIILATDQSDLINQEVTQHPVTVTDLLYATTYNFKVRALCGDDLYSDWSEIIAFTTNDQIICESVTNVAVSNITTNSASITWTAGGDELEWEVEYGHHNFTLGHGENSETDLNVFMLEDLTEATAYDVYVRAICGENFYSEWSDTLQFTTLASEPEGIDGVEGNFQFTIYPNPTSNTTTIRLNGVEGQVEISIVDMNGRMLQTETLECGSDCEKRIDIAHLSQGTYFVRVLGNGINSVRKLIVR